MPRNLNTPNNDSADILEILLSTFPTKIGWMGILGRDRKVIAVVIGHPSAASVLHAARQSIKDDESVNRQTIQLDDWLPELRQDLQDYAEGKPVEFKNLKLELRPQTRFRDRVLAATRSLKYGETTTYGELARRVGHPGAARAVGTVMSTNRFPILIPCHRVLAAGGKLGGYTSPTGTDLKRKLLEMEHHA
jgi:methylated-DNA-[protein]-cysteine S-methyltransferase